MRANRNPTRILIVTLALAVPAAAAADRVAPPEADARAANACLHPAHLVQATGRVRLAPPERDAIATDNAYQSSLRSPAGC